ncbi:MAG: hypothetical protein ACP5EN_03335 [Rhodovulum sp.]
MINLLKSALVSLALSVATAGVASAASLGLATKALPVVDIVFAEAVYFETGGTGDLFWTAPALGLATAVPSASEAEFDIALTFDIANPYGSVTGALLSADRDGNPYLEGDLVAIGFQDDLLELLFGNLSGSAAPAFGSQALVELFFIGPVGADPLAGLSDLGVYDLAGTIVAPVPLPGGLPLLAGGVVLLAGLRARRTAS